MDKKQTFIAHKYSIAKQNEQLWKWCAHSLEIDLDRKPTAKELVQYYMITKKAYWNSENVIKEAA